ncbi:cysteine desulfurase [Oceaniovalibus guishaninsula JLT2003]|uniref:Cysteine desulfurase n=1 Tax=Oceaniovalibus guishaninsula JLT2003 TaxID=1231392 RepID=K2I3S5_9RHOB|nr:aminotransferase class V-fold PLP-dependent enzyme [Oceaniovalibus guishaninsula]EKE43520.1 cysteine desulfurase [Oceaniovalibus guishaninsula JLT2003]
MKAARVYLDWNASAPLRPEARRAMLDAMDVTGNPSSVHTEGRAARRIVEHARAQIAEATGAQGADIVFTSGATEAAALACAGRGLSCAPVEHQAILAWCDKRLGVDADGAIAITDPGGAAVQGANSETGILQTLPPGLAVTDATQAFGKIPFAFDWMNCDMAILSAHKFGGPKGIGALLLRRGTEIAARIRGGGQELGRRAGTENVAAIAGFGAAADCASRDLAAGRWDAVAELRNILEKALASGPRQTIFVGNDVARLPNTTCIVTPDLKGETQVMRMDLAGFAVSAGSACSSGKVRGSSGLAAMGFDDAQARSAVRVSIGPATTKDDILRFADTWRRSLETQRTPAVHERSLT